MSKLSLTASILFSIAVAAVTGIALSAAPSKEQYSPADLVGALHTAFGSHHARAVHTKGLILEGTFAPDAQAAALTTAVHLQSTASKLVVRFSDFTGLPDIPDNAGPANPRGIAIRFTLPDGTFSDIVGHSFDGFPTRSSDQFHDLLLAIAKGGTTLDNFLATHPIAKRFLTTQKIPASYATVSYFGVNSFKFTAKDGSSRFVRYQFEPVAGEKLLTADENAKQSASYLQDEIKARVAKGSIQFKMYAQIAEASDAVGDPSIAWPAQRKRVALGVLTINKLGANTVEQDKAFALSPINLVPGIETADPMLDFRGRAYPLSVKERR